MPDTTIGPGGVYSTWAAWKSSWDTVTPWTEPWTAKLLGDTTGDNLLTTFTGDMNGHYAECYTDPANRGIGGRALPTLNMSGTLRGAAGGTGMHDVRFTGVALIDSSFQDVIVSLLSGANFSYTFRDALLAGGRPSAASALMTLNQPQPVSFINTVVECVQGRLWDTRGGGDVTVINSFFRNINGNGDFGLLGGANCSVYLSSFSGWTSSDIFDLITTGGDNVTADASGATFGGAGSVGNVVFTDADQAGAIWLVENLATFDYRLKDATTGTNQPTIMDNINAEPLDALGVTRGTPKGAGPFFLSGAPPPVTDEPSPGAAQQALGV